MVKAPFPATVLFIYILMHISENYSSSTLWQNARGNLILADLALKQEIIIASRLLDATRKITFELW